MSNKISGHSNFHASAENRIKQFMKPGKKFLTSLEEQYSTFYENQNYNLAQDIKNIYENAREDLEKIRDREEYKIGKYKEGLNKKQIRKFAKDLKKAQIEIAKRIVKAQKETRVAIAKELVHNQDARINLLSKENIIYKIALTILTAFDDEWKKAAKALKDAEDQMKITAIYFSFPDKTINKLEQERFADYVRLAPRRQGVMLIQKQARIRPEFSLAKVKNQLKSLQAQLRSEKEREVLSHTFNDLLGKDKEVEEEIIPLNKYFDDKVGETFFGDILGVKGISSQNRQEKHLINGFQTTLKALGKTFKAFRHGAISSLLAPNEKVRQKESNAMAEELVVAALLESLKAQGMTLADASKSEKPIKIDLTSVSLVTPDYFRSISFLGQTSERKMLQNQFLALKKANELKSITINDYLIPLEVIARTFNFGVNEGAIGKLKFLPGIKLGLDTQFKINDESWGGDIHNSLYSDAIRLLDTIGVQDETHDAIRSLIDDLNILMFTKDAYLQGSQYEAGAKIINLCNLMTIYSQEHKQACIDEKEILIKGKEEIFNKYGFDTSALDITITKLKEKLKDLKNLPAEYTVAFNCYSGKDRTGIMDCIAKAFFIMYLKFDRCPTFKELNTEESIPVEHSEILNADESPLVELSDEHTEDKILRDKDAKNELLKEPLEVQKIEEKAPLVEPKGEESAELETPEEHSPKKTAEKVKSYKQEFSEIVTQLLLESGNLIITELNGGALGFKITENSAKFAGLPLGDYLAKYVGLGKTTRS